MLGQCLRGVHPWFIWNNTNSSLSVSVAEAHSATQAGKSRYTSEGRREDKIFSNKARKQKKAGAEPVDRNIHEVGRLHWVQLLLFQLLLLFLIQWCNGKIYEVEVDRQATGDCGCLRHKCLFRYPMCWGDGHMSQADSAEASQNPTLSWEDCHPVVSSVYIETLHVVPSLAVINYKLY